MSRRALLGAAPAAGLIAAAVVACDTAPEPRREPRGVSLLAPATFGRARRVAAWNTRFFDTTRLQLALTPPSGAHQAPGRFATVSALRELLASGGAGTTWLAWAPHEAVPALALGEQVRPLEGLARRDSVNLKVFMPCALQPAYGLDDRLYALPESVDAGQLYFNRQHLLDAGMDFRRAGLDFENPNCTWETLRQAGLDLLQSRFARERLPWHPGAAGAPLELWGWLNGGGWISADGRRATFMREENVQALTWLAKHAQELGGAERLALPGQMAAPASSGSGADEPERNPLLSGRVSMHFDSTRFVSTLAGANAAFPIGYVEAPRRWDKAPLVTWARSSGYALVRGAPDDAWQTLRFLVSEDAAIVDAATELGGAPIWTPSPVGPPLMPGPLKRLWFPPYTGQLAVDKRLAGRHRTESKLIDEAHDHGLEQLRHARFRERSPAAEGLWPLLQEARMQALSGTPPHDALQAAQGRAQALLDEAWPGSR